MVVFLPRTVLYFFLNLVLVSCFKPQFLFKGNFILSELFLVILVVDYLKQDVEESCLKFHGSMTSQ